MPDAAPVLPCDTAEIVYEKPASGDFTEILFGSDRGNTLWIRFADQDGLHEWIGKFGCGFRAPMRIIKAIEPDKFTIIAGGFAYFVDATQRKLLNHYCDDTYHIDIAYDPLNNRFIVGDVHLKIIENGAEIWRSPRIALDGICGLTLHDRILTGQAMHGYEEESEPFALDLDTREFLPRPRRAFP